MDVSVRQTVAAGAKEKLIDLHERAVVALALARDENVATGAAIEVGADLDNELARIDAQLRQPGLDSERQLALWRARVDTLRSAVSFESTRRWLVAQGERYDGSLVQVD